jgi:hypothetical protein
MRCYIRQLTKLEQLMCEYFGVPSGGFYALQQGTFNEFLATHQHLLNHLECWVTLRQPTGVAHTLRANTWLEVAAVVSSCIALHCPLWLAGGVDDEQRHLFVFRLRLTLCAHFQLKDETELGMGNVEDILDRFALDRGSAAVTAQPVWEYKPGALVLSETPSLLPLPNMQRLSAEPTEAADRRDGAVGDDDVAAVVVSDANLLVPHCQGFQGDHTPHAVWQLLARVPCLLDAEVHLQWPLKFFPQFGSLAQFLFEHQTAAAAAIGTDAALVLVGTPMGTFRIAATSWLRPDTYVVVALSLNCLVFMGVADVFCALFLHCITVDCWL